MYISKIPNIDTCVFIQTQNKRNCFRHFLSFVSSFYSQMKNCKVSTTSQKFSTKMIYFYTTITKSNNNNNSCKVVHERLFVKPFHANIAAIPMQGQLRDSFGKYTSI